MSSPSSPEVSSPDLPLQRPRPRFLVEEERRMSSTSRASTPSTSEGLLSPPTLSQFGARNSFGSFGSFNNGKRIDSFASNSSLSGVRAHSRTINQPNPSHVARLALPRCWSPIVARIRGTCIVTIPARQLAPKRLLISCRSTRSLQTCRRGRPSIRQTSKKTMMSCISQNHRIAGETSSTTGTSGPGAPSRTSCRCCCSRPAW